MTGARRAVGWIAGALLLALPGRLSAQVDMTISGTPVTFPSPTGANFTAGFVLANGTVAYLVNQTGGAANIVHTTIVSIRATTATLGGTKPVTDLQWQRADQPGTWNSVTTADVVIESRAIKKNLLNDTWTNTLTFRTLLNYSTDAPATYSANLVLTLTVTTP